MALRRKLLTGCAIAAAIASTLAQASQSTGQATPTLKVTVQNVILDVTVYNGNGYTSRGNPVPDLHKEDFEVLEDGKPQTITFFEERKDVPFAQAHPASQQPDEEMTNAPALSSEDQSPTILLLDTGNTDFDDQPWMLSQVRQFLKSEPPGKPIALFALTPGLRILHGFTTDPSVLLAALDNNAHGIHPLPSPFMQSRSEAADDKRSVQMLRDAAAEHASPALAAMAKQLERFQKNMLRTETVQRTINTFEAFQEIARSLAAVPGRKNLIWLASSFTERPFGADSSFDDEVKKTVNLLNAARIAVYPVDSGGLTYSFFDAAAATSTGVHDAKSFNETMTKEENQNSLARNTSTETMEDIAHRTGGEAYYNTNDITSAMERVVSQSNDYYTLAYTPNDSKLDGSYRRIQVRYKGHSRLAYRIAYRRGYYAVANRTIFEQAQKNGDPLSSLMEPSQPNFSQIVFKAQMLPAAPEKAAASSFAGQNYDLKGSFTRYNVNMAVSTKSMTFHEENNRAYGNFALEIVAYNEQGYPINWLSKHYEPSLNVAEYAAFRRHGLQLASQLDLPQGLYFVRIGIYDLNNDKAGTLEFPLTVAAKQPLKARASQP